MPTLREERLSDIVEDAPDPLCVTGMFCVPMVKFPVRVCVLEFPVTDQDALVADATTDAQLMFELAAIAGQDTGLVVIPRLPEPPLEPMFTLPGFIV